MDFDYFVEGPILLFTFSLFIIGVITRMAFFATSILKSNHFNNSGWAHFLANFGRFFVPFHNAARKDPIYAILRYIFHICLLVVPIWFSGHIFLWEESTLELYWRPLPDAWVDRLTLLLLVLTAYFLIRRIVLTKILFNSTISDYFIIIITAIPFLTGYFLTHGTLDSVSFLRDNMWTIHVLSGEIMLIMAVFIFYKSRLNVEKCTGCASCVLNCPTGTLESNDEENLRTFSYSHYQCICCGSCVNTCPEDAVELRHEIGIRNFFRIFSKDKIRTVELAICEICGAFFAPEPQIAKVEKVDELITNNFIRVCPKCRRDNYAKIFHRGALRPG